MCVTSQCLKNFLTQWLHYNPFIDEPYWEISELSPNLCSCKQCWYKSFLHMCRSTFCTLFSDGLMAPTAMQSASNPSPGALSQIVFPQPIPMKRDGIRSFKYIFLIGWTYCSFSRDIYLIISQHVTMSLNGRTQERCRARPHTSEFSRLVLGSCPGQAVPRPLIAGFPALTRLSLLSPWRTHPALSWTRTLVAMQLPHTSMSCCFQSQ